MVGVQTLYYALGIIFMLGGAVVAEQYVSKEYMNESERRILDSIRDLACRIDNVLHINRD